MWSTLSICCTENNIDVLIQACTVHLDIIATSVAAFIVQDGDSVLLSMTNIPCLLYDSTLYVDQSARNLHTTRHLLATRDHVHIGVLQLYTCDKLPCSLKIGQGSRGSSIMPSYTLPNMA